MIIVVEGPDNSGKSTFCEALAREAQYRELAVSVKHTSQPKTADPYGEYRAELYSGFPPMIPKPRHVFVYDRLHWGEIVYSELYRPGENAYDVSEFLLNELQLARQGGVVVHLTHDPAVLRERGEANGEDFLQPEDVVACVDGFRRVFDYSVAPAITLVDPAHSDAVDVLNFATTLTAAAVRFDPPDEYLGHIDPDVIFVVPPECAALEEVPCADLTMGRTILEAVFASYQQRPQKFGFATPYAFSKMDTENVRAVILTSDDAPRVETSDAYATRINLEDLWLDS